MRTQIWKVEFGSIDVARIVATNPKEAIKKAIRLKKTESMAACRLQDITCVELEAIAD